jgi:hypothetical protein
MAKIRLRAHRAAPVLASALVLGVVSPLRAQEPAPDAPAGARQVRRAGGAHAPKVSVQRSNDPAEQGEPAALPSAARERALAGKLAAHERLAQQVREARERAHERLEQAQAKGEAEPPGEPEGEAKPAGKPDSAQKIQQARRARWQTLAHAFARPSEIPRALRAELALHARRVARLQRIRVLAAADDDLETVARADALLELERQRHATTLQTHVQAHAQAKRAAVAAEDQAAEEAEPAEVEAEEEGAE